MKPEKIDYIRERQGESLMAVDDAVAAIVAALEHSGRLRDTNDHLHVGQRPADR